MRELVDRARVLRVIDALAESADRDARVYFTGGATAVLFGWRDATIDVDMVVVPDVGALPRAIPAIKESLAVNVEFVSPAHFIPVRDGWEDRSPQILQKGGVSFHHFDLYAQALAKLERRHPRDRLDVRAMLERKLIEADVALAYFHAIEPELYRFPAIDPPTFRRVVEETFGPARLSPRAE